MDRFQKRKQTKERRKTQRCRVYELKIDQSHLSKKTLNELSTLFREAKWFYNYVISQESINDADYTAKSVPVKVGDIFEDRNFTILSGAMKQAIKSRTFGSVKSLSELKKKGYKIGILKFKSFINSVPLQQFRKTHKLDFERSRIRIQNIKQWMRVRGLSQVPDDVEIANATLVRKPSGFYFHLTTFERKDQFNIPDKVIGIDFGYHTQLTLSDGTKIEFQIKESKRLKRLSRRIDKKVNGKIGKYRNSNNRRKLQTKRRKEYERLKSKKQDIRNKIVSTLTKNYRTIIFQDENISKWHSNGHGKKVQHSAIGSIIADLKNKAVNPIIVDKFFPSTQLCPRCGVKNKMPVEKRIYECECGFKEDRDLKSACCILEEGLKTNNIPMDHRNYKPEEIEPSVDFGSIVGTKVYKVPSRSQEAAGLALR